MTIVEREVYPQGAARCSPNDLGPRALSGDPMNEPQEGISPSDVARMQNPPTVPLPVENTPINKFEVRRYEVAQLMPDGSWRQVYHLRDTELARRQAISDAKWFNSRGRGTFQARVLVSCELPAEMTEPPLVLDADMDPQDIPQEVVEAMINDVELESDERRKANERADREPEGPPESGEPFAKEFSEEWAKQDDSTPSSELGGEG